ncbi:MAG: hypothetical protein WC130_04350 [Kiritimatiellia bacterium]
MKETAVFNLTEEGVAAALGLTRETVRQLRADELYLDEDFINEGGHGICYSPSAIEKLRLILKESAAPGAKLRDIAVLTGLPTSAEPKSPGPSASDHRGTVADRTDGAATVILDAVVTKIYAHNPYYLEALLGAKTINVRVKSNVNFILGMALPIRNLSEKNPRQYDFIGRCPRGRGKW